MARLTHTSAQAVLACLGVFALLLMIAMVVGLAIRGRFSHSAAQWALDGAGTGGGQGTDSDRLRARELCSAGHFDAAFQLYRAHPAGRWQAGDSFALGTALLDRDRIVLGWAALESAHRIDAQHARCNEGLDKLQSKMALAQGRERLVMHDAASRVEWLSAVPDGPPLGMLVVGLAGSANDLAQEQDLLDRLAIRDPSALRGVVSLDDAVKLVARLLMEVGQPMKARDLLEPLVASAAPAQSTSQERRDRSPGTTLDREAAWLLSRAAMQLDQEEAADAALALAGEFGQGSVSSPEPAPFVGSKRCGECHRFLYRQVQRSSRHAHTLGVGTGLKDVPLPSRAIADPHFPGLSHSMTRENVDRIEISSRIEDRVARAVVEYALGSGRHGITMVAKDGEGIERELRVSYFGDGQSWGETKGITTAPRDPGDQIGLALAPKPLRRCLHCHSTWFGAVDLGRSAPKGPEALDHGIGCERCHGPGLNHIKAVESGFAQVAISLSATSPASMKLQSCTECHASDGSVDPSDPEFTRAQGTTLLFSQCYTISRGRLGCTTCHDPHGALDNTLSHYDVKCLDCHPASLAKATERPAETPPMTDRSIASGGPTCPVNPAAYCASCHMPKVETADRRSRFTDHHIRVHRD
jgi:hypothetical protein